MKKQYPISSLMNYVSRDNKVIVKKISDISNDLPGVMNFKSINKSLLNKNYYIEANILSNYIYEFEYYENYAFEFNVDNIDKMSEIINDLHSVDYSNLNEFNLFSMYEKYKESAGLPIEVSSIEKDIYNKVKNDSKFQKKSFCHNDLNSTNILLGSNGFKIIDFDFGGINYKIFDIVRFFTQNGLSLSVRRAFLDSYCNDNNKSTFQNINDWESFETMFSIVWARHMFLITNNIRFKNIESKKIEYLVRKDYANYEYD